MEKITYTDDDGWYFAQFLATGKKALYNVYWDVDDNGIDSGDRLVQTEMGGSAGKWAYVDFTVVNPGDYDPAATPTPDYLIDTYDAGTTGALI